MKRTLVGFLAAGLAACSSALAQSPNPHVAPLTPSLTLQGSEAQGGAFLGTLGDTVITPRWVLAQWGTPTSLSPAYGPASGWTVATDKARITWDNAGQRYEMAQAGNVCGVERDFFLSATSEPPAGAAAGFTPTPALSQMGALEVSATLELRYFTTTSACRNAYGQYVYTLVLQTNNNPGNPGAEQTLFYQITFGRNVNPGTKVFNWCYEYEAANSGNAFCLDDDVRASGGYFVVYPGSGVSSFDVLPRLREVLHNGHKKANLNVSLDTDASHWVVKAIYVGGILQGQTNDTIRLSDIRMNSYAGGSFGNGIQTAYTCGQGKPPFAGWVDAGSGCFHRNTGKAY